MLPVILFALQASQVSISSVREPARSPRTAEPVAGPRNAQATLARRAPVIDGRDDDAIWTDAQKITAFRQFDPQLEKTAGVFTTFPAFPSWPQAGFLDQVIGTALLLLLVLAITDELNVPPGANLTPAMIGLVTSVVVLMPMAAPLIGGILDTVFG